MQRKVQIYIDTSPAQTEVYEQIDLFNDEQINVNSTIQNIADISKTFTDFSQSFTVPASVNNNKIFYHWYNSDVDLYNGNAYNVNTRKNARLEIQLTPFRSGKIQLDKANIKDGKPQSYTITFFGDITSLKDNFGEDLLSDVDFSSLDHNYTGTEVYNRITDHTTDYSVRYPLISSERYWINQGGTTNDITSSNGRIVYSELFPAVKVSKMFEAIGTHYGVTLNGTFLSDPKFTDLFLWCKNTKENTFITGAQKLDYTSQVIPSTHPTHDFDISTDTFTYSYNDQSAASGTFANPLLFSFRIEVSITPSSQTTDYYIDVYKNGFYNNTIQGIGTATYLVVNDQNAPGLNNSVQLFFRAANNMTINHSARFFVLFDFSIQQELDIFQLTGAAQTIIGNTSLSTLMPEMKVNDFFSGILKMFNLTCYGTALNTFEIETLDTFYSLGQTFDITEYTDIKSIDVNKVPLYKKMAFKYQESKSVLNSQYKGLFFREYGNAEYTFNYDGGDFIINLPFENLMGQRFTNSNLHVAYSLDENLQPYTPKPCLFYMYENKSTSVKFYDGSAEQTITNYLPFGQDALINSTEEHTLNFNADRSTITLQAINNTLYKNYYSLYLQNLYSTKNRLISVKTRLPISLLTELKLNDRLIIRDRRYTINEMKSNLTTGDVNFTLLLDFREVLPAPVIPTGPAAGCVDVPINLPNGVCSVAIATTTGGVTITPSTVTSSQVISVCVPANTNTQNLIVTEDTNLLFPPILRKFLNTEDFFRIETEGSALQTITLNLTYTYCNGAVNDSQIVIQQP